MLNPIEFLRVSVPNSEKQGLLFSFRGQESKPTIIIADEHEIMDSLEIPDEYE